MKLVIHCGLHKTATTSFQKLCTKNRALLRSLGVHYPKYGYMNQHSCVLWETQRRGVEALGSYFAKIHGEAQDDCHTVLLSGEDFENCIVDLALASEIESLALEAGFTNLVWVVVSRPVNEAVSSLYSEMSKHDVVLRLDIVRAAAKERGCLYISSPQYNYIFILDYARFAERFRRHVSGKVLEFEFKDFVLDHPGMSLLQQLLSEDKFRQFREAANLSGQHDNKRRGSIIVEIKYLFNALGLYGHRRVIFAPVLAPLIWLRLRTKRQVEKPVSSDQSSD